MSLSREVTADLFRAIAEYTYDWETWVDAEGTTRWINDAVERITGYGVAECMLLPGYPLALACESDLPLLERVLSDARSGGSGNDVEFRVLTKSGALRWVAISWQSVRSAEGAALGYRTSVRDIDERKHMEDELHRLRRRAEALAQARSELLANVSHELRSPAHCIGGFAELLLQGPLADKQRHYVSIILDQCRSMQRQVEDLLSLTALEAGGVELSHDVVDVVALVQSLIEVNEPTAEALGLSLSAEVRLDDRFIEADGLRLQQILRNLIDNALKFTERGAIELCVRSEGDAGAPRLCFEVRDTGRGMDPALIDTMLLPFRQADARANRRHTGVGLGLAIVERLVRAMGGELVIESEPGVGTEVSVRVPWVRARAQQPSVAAESELRPGTALVVDDTPAAREVLCALLESCGFSAVQAATAEVAKALVSEQTFDVIFVDYQMPDSDGAQTALLLRRGQQVDEARGPVPIFILTANVFAREQLREARAWVDGILSKPLSRSALLQVLAQLPRARVAEPAQEVLLREDVVQDLQTARHRSGQSLLHKLLPEVARDVALALEQADLAYAGRAADALRRAAHALSGQALLLGAVRAASSAQRLELAMEQASERDWTTAHALLEAYRSAWDAARQALSERVRAQSLDKS